MSMQRVVLITGCSSGIGLGVAKVLKSRGWRVFATARKAEDVARLSADGFDALQLDVCDPASMERSLATLLTLSGGHLDALVNNAGIAVPGAVEDLSRDNLQQQFDTNFFGLVELTRRVLPVMRRQGSGRVVMISSILGRVAMPWRGAYNASKHALEGLTDTLRLELRGSGIRVSLVNPGPVKSRFRDNSLTNFERQVDTSTSVHTGRYARLQAETGARKDDQPFTVGPEAVAAKVAHALESRRPKARYYVTLPAYVLATARCLLPTAWLDAILARV
ncbi:MAG TPA: SDR family NAD(P)-dependent oxidoreductase [Gammaproteobacteria bacterium]|jgi:NAD(P)-dependent dehydrogenase (short-subunit alcohol dehydrogenase family)